MLSVSLELSGSEGGSSSGSAKSPSSVGLPPPPAPPAAGSCGWGATMGRSNLSIVRRRAEGQMRLDRNGEDSKIIQIRE